MPRSEGIETVQPSLMWPSHCFSRNECPDQRGLKRSALILLSMSIFTRNECPDQRGLKPSCDHDFFLTGCTSERMPRSEGIETNSLNLVASSVIVISERMPRSEGIETFLQTLYAGPEHHSRNECPDQRGLKLTASKTNMRALCLGTNAPIRGD